MPFQPHCPARAQLPFAPASVVLLRVRVCKLVFAGIASDACACVRAFAGDQVLADLELSAGPDRRGGAEQRRLRRLLARHSEAAGRAH
eukprot:2771410-Pleurochrysis_carterae.AAC.1